ncbi:MAG: endonuclease III [Candidatus Dojkabacteria bacterium]
MTRQQQILTILKKTYPHAKCALVHGSAWQLLLATILSAQCTDVRVNIVTKELFAGYPTVEDIDKLDIRTLRKLIRTTGFYNNKAKNVKGAARMVIEDYGGKVPDSLEELIKLPGVARKTANVVLGVWYKKNEGVVVDTHVKRIAFRLGLTKETNPEKVERDLMRQYEQKDWERLATLLIFHGRALCTARKPKCAQCPLNKICPSAFTFD